MYECDECFYVVMDACMGGDLHDFFQCIGDNDSAFERELRGIMGPRPEPRYQWRGKQLTRGYVCTRVFFSL